MFPLKRAQTAVNSIGVRMKGAPARIHSHGGHAHSRGRGDARHAGAEHELRAHARAMFEAACGWPYARGLSRHRAAVCGVAEHGARGVLRVAGRARRSAGASVGRGPRVIDALINKRVYTSHQTIVASRPRCSPRCSPRTTSPGRTARSAWACCRARCP